MKLTRKFRRAAWKAVCKRRGLPPGTTPRDAWQQYKLDSRGR